MNSDAKLHILCRKIGKKHKKAKRIMTNDYRKAIYMQKSSNLSKTISSTNQRHVFGNDEHNSYEYLSN